MTLAWQTGRWPQEVKGASPSANFWASRKRGLWGIKMDLNTSMWGYQSISHKSLMNPSKNGTNCISYHWICQDVPNIIINKTRMFAWYLSDRSPKPESKCFILTGTGVADGSYWDTKAKANVAVQNNSLNIFLCIFDHLVLSGSGFICKLNAQGSLHYVYIYYYINIIDIIYP